MANWKNNHPKPIIGLAGGVGAGKSAVADALAALGCGVIRADTDAHAVLREEDVKKELVALWGPGVIAADGQPNRKAIAAIVFNNPAETARLNGLIHPRVARQRTKRTAELMQDPAVVAVIWDAPLLFELGLEQECDAVIFVKAPYEQRVKRVAESRGWTAAELDRREKMQIALDKKQNMADYVVDNNGEVSAIPRQVQRVLSQILSRKSPEK
jgi:dephospho-CoA kinase